MIGDLPDADMKPPENVLFVCKLNPVTTDDDLEIIFTRCGEKKGKKTWDNGNVQCNRMSGFSFWLVVSLRPNQSTGTTSRAMHASR